MEIEGIINHHEPLTTVSLSINAYISWEGWWHWGAGCPSISMKGFIQVRAGSQRVLQNKTTFAFDKNGIGDGSSES